MCFISKRVILFWLVLVVAFQVAWVSKAEENSSVDGQDNTGQEPFPENEQSSNFDEDYEELDKTNEEPLSSEDENLSQQEREHIQKQPAEHKKQASKAILKRGQKVNKENPNKKPSKKEAKRSESKSNSSNRKDTSDESGKEAGQDKNRTTVKSRDFYQQASKDKSKTDDEDRASDGDVKDIANQKKDTGGYKFEILSDIDLAEFRRREETGDELHDWNPHKQDLGDDSQEKVQVIYPGASNNSQVIKSVDYHFIEIKKKGSGTEKDKSSSEFGEEINHEEKLEKMQKLMKEAVKKRKSAGKGVGKSKGSKYSKTRQELTVPKLFPRAKVQKKEVDILLQQYTLLLHSGENCYHQSVTSDSLVSLYYIDKRNEPIKVTVLNDNGKILHEVSSNRTGTIIVSAEEPGLYHFCFYNPRWIQKQVYVAFQVVPNEWKKDEYWYKSDEGKVFVIADEMQQVNGLLQRVKARWTLDYQLQVDYVSSMNQRSWCLLITALIVYIAQVYAIHQLFNGVPPGNSIQFRTKV